MANILHMGYNRFSLFDGQIKAGRRFTMLIATCDDENQYCEQVEQYIEKLGKALDIEIHCDKYNSGTKLLQNYTNQYQMIFLDIDMKSENGMRIAEKIREVDDKVEIVFLTAMIQYAVEGYRVNAYRFLVKPATYDDFAFQLSDILLRIDSYTKEYIELSQSDQNYKIKLEDIIYIESVSHEMVFSCVNETIRIRGALKKLEKMLNKNFFARIHNSYIINMKHIKDVLKQEVVMKNEMVLPVSRSKKDSFRQSYMDFWGDELG